MHYVYSTLSASVSYAIYEKSGGDLPTRTRAVTIKGGANVADRKTDTPRGIVTEVTDEDLAVLEASPVFQAHKKNGFIVVVPKEIKIEKAVADMVEKDKSAPLTPDDFVSDTGVQPSEEFKKNKKSR